MSKAEIDNLKEVALSALEAQPLSNDELRETLKRDEETVREIVWQLINGRQIEMTRDWKLKAAQLQVV